MSITTKVECAGLARDAAPEIGSKANGLRRAENVVLRSPGVLETRPSFDLLFEAQNTPLHVRALREFQGTVLIVTKAVSGPFSGTWFVTNQYGVTFVSPLENAFEAPDYDASETRFAEGRMSLHMTGSQGVVVFENFDPLVKPARMSGVDVRMHPSWRVVPRILGATSTGRCWERSRRSLLGL